MSSKKYVTLGELSKRLAFDKSNLRRYILKHGFDFKKIRGPHNQLEIALSLEEAEQIVELRQSQGFDQNVKEPIDENNGYFYIIQLIPDFHESRLKFGFSTDFNSRLAALRTSSPTAKLLKSWPCMKKWEQTAISSITRIESSHVGNEVYDCKSVKKAIQRAEDFFNLLP